LAIISYKRRSWVGCQQPLDVLQRQLLPNCRVQVHLAAEALRSSSNG
jgi:hypothetical protein